VVIGALGHPTIVAQGTGPSPPTRPKATAR
jgi:hypothetical protein